MPKAKKKKNKKNTRALTKREKEILHLVTKEYTNKDIADTLYISLSTVESHRYNMMKKVGAKNFYGVIMFAFKNKLIK